MGTMQKVFEALHDSAPGLTTSEVAARVKPRGVKNPEVAVRSALTRLRLADQVRGERCKDGKHRWRRV